MPIFSGLVANCSGVLHKTSHRISLFQNQGFKIVTSKNVRSGSLSYSTAARIRAATCSRGNNPGTSFDDGYVPEPFLISSVKEFYADLRSLLMFLIEQPGQLKYIEWPGFQSTFKTATLTLVLVAMLIVALSSVDSALAYILAWFLRKSP